MILLHSWWIFSRERFPIFVQGPMIFLFVATNYQVSNVYFQQKWNYLTFCVLAMLGLMFFFRLRCFDELKDYDVDLKVNPERPLARGLLSKQAVKTMIALLVAVESILAASFFGWQAFLGYLLPLSYSLLMYEEFFIGHWLAPRLTSYAVTHTFVACLLGLGLCYITHPFATPIVWQQALGLALYNWFQFNIFEFARKTFASKEEKPNHDSYTSLFGPTKAVLLTLSQVVLSGLLVKTLDIQIMFYAYAAVGIFLSVPGLFFIVRKNIHSARIFRTCASIYLVAAYAVVLIFIK